jgi:hypothetical protein
MRSSACSISTLMRAQLTRVGHFFSCSHRPGWAPHSTMLIGPSSARTTVPTLVCSGASANV